MGLKYEDRNLVKTWRKPLASATASSLFIREVSSTCEFHRGEYFGKNTFLKVLSTKKYYTF